MPIAAYLSLSRQLFTLQIDESQLKHAVTFLPVLTDSLLEDLASEAEKESGTHPRLGWSIALAANMAATLQTNSLWLQSLSAWYLARAANRWARPLLVKSAIQKARLGFTQLHEPGWLAACDWLSNDLAWFQADHAHSAEVLAKALPILESSQLQDFAPYCRLALAANQIFMNQLPEVKNNLETAEDKFVELKDEFGQAQCWISIATVLRMDHQYDLSMKKLNTALEVFTGLQKIPFIAKTVYYKGINFLFGSTDIAKTSSLFRQADSLFIECDMELWHGICQNYLGLTILQDGQLQQAEESLETAAKIFRRNHVLNNLADIHDSIGLLNLSKGNPQKSIVQFTQAQKLHKRVGQALMYAVDTANLGKAYFLSGLYQDALIQLEKAVSLLTKLNDTLTVADCEADLASAWFLLRNFSRSFEHLQKAADLYQIHQQNASLTTLNILKAKIYFEVGDLDNSIVCLQKALERSQQFKLRPQAALAHRLLGEVLGRNKQFADALFHLQTSLTQFSTMGMSIEEASCWLALGDLHSLANDLEESKNSYLQALSLSAGSFDEIDWRSYTGLAQTFEFEGNKLEALAKYRQSITSLGKIRSNFWQASLAGTYFSSPVEMFARAIPLSFEVQSTADVLEFIDASKANSLIHQSNSTGHGLPQKTSQEMENLITEINWLQNQMGASSQSQNNLKTAVQNRQLHQRLSEKSKEYDELNSRLERNSAIRKRTSKIESTLNIAIMQETFNQNLDQNWLALDYFTCGDHIYLAAITSGKTSTFQREISPRERISLDACKNSWQNGFGLTEDDLAILGKLLIPSELVCDLPPQTTLIISPHDQLHSIPWNALIPSTDGKFLVETWVPVITPSLESAVMQWRIPLKNNSELRQKGLVVGLSSFGEMHPALPYVKKEIASFASIQKAGGMILQEEQAVWKNLVQLSRSGSPKGLSKFTFLHLASHFFSDSVSGRLSGLALWNETIYQDQLHELAPLPELVTLSGCSSTFSHTYPGDEHIGLPTTCLMAGARSVIGSNWPVLDPFSADFMIDFYSTYFQGQSPAVSLAQTQRAFINQHNPISSWAGYRCIGRP
ncbi:MAG: CHAT domain-containing protein [Anaerolineaceae bacterium]